MKFIHNPDNVKVGYLYKIVDDGGEYIINILEHKKDLNGDMAFHFNILIDGQGKSTKNLSSLTHKYVSEYPETDVKFDRAYYAWYEIGAVKDRPEYFL